MKLIQEINSNYKCYAFGTMQVDILVTGIGSVFMAHALTQALKMVNYDMALNIGLAESFDHFLEQGFVVNIIQEQFADLGIDYQDNFYTLGEQELMNDNAFPFHEGKLLSLGNFELSEVEALIPVKGITVNALRNTSDWLSLLRKKYDPEIQTLTGASFFYVCMMEKIPFLQIRAISGFVEIRRVDSWNIPIAVNNLAESTLQILKELDID
ncbi:MAG: hypothetical protein MI922_03820 [Bacteroidales bacterium]|nr:hypothetical protein [Bacteroidales bacterium]